MCGVLLNSMYGTKDTAANLMAIVMNALQNFKFEIEKDQLGLVQTRRDRDITLFRDGDDLVILAQGDDLEWFGRHAEFFHVKRRLNEGSKWRRLGDARNFRIMCMRSNSLARRQDQLVLHTVQAISRWVNSTPAASGVEMEKRRGRHLLGRPQVDPVVSCSDCGAASNDDASSHRKIKRRVSDFARYVNSFSMTRMTKDHGCGDGGLQQ